MGISDLQSGQGNVNVEGTISEMGEVRTFNKFGKELRVANAILKDGTGSIKLSLWNDDVARFKEGDKVKVVNGYVNEFQGENQLTSGKFGKIEMADGAGQSKLPSDSEGAMSEDDSDEGMGDDSGDESIEEVEY